MALMRLREEGAGDCRFDSGLPLFSLQDSRQHANISLNLMPRVHPGRVFRQGSTRPFF